MVFVVVCAADVDCICVCVLVQCADGDCFRVQTDEEPVLTDVRSVSSLDRYSLGCSPVRTGSLLFRIRVQFSVKIAEQCVQSCAEQCSVV